MSQKEFVHEARKYHSQSTSRKNLCHRWPKSIKRQRDKSRHTCLVLLIATFLLPVATSEMICKTVARGVHGSYLLVGTRIHKNVSMTLRRRRRRIGILGNAKVMCYRLVGELPYPRPFTSLTTYSIGLIKTRRFLSENRRRKWPPVRPTRADRMS